MAEKTSWDTESGLLDEFRFEVSETWFGIDEEVDDPTDKVYLFLRGAAFDEDGELVDDEHRERYSTGKNWEVVEDGTEVENATGKNRFNQNAGIGRLINALVALGGDVAKALAKRGDAYEAATFNGITMEMERKLVSKWKGDDGEDLEWYLSLPNSVEFPKAKGKKSKSKKGGSGKASRAKGKGSKKPSLRSDIIDFAAEFDEDEHDDFVDQVLDDSVFARAEEIQEDDELHAEVLDADSKLWAKAH